MSGSREKPVSLRKAFCVSSDKPVPSSLPVTSRMSVSKLKFDTSDGLSSGFLLVDVCFALLNLKLYLSLLPASGFASLDEL